VSRCQSEEEQEGRGAGAAAGDVPRPSRPVPRRLAWLRRLLRLRRIIDPRWTDYVTRRGAVPYGGSTLD